MRSTRAKLGRVFLCVFVFSFQSALFSAHSLGRLPLNAVPQTNQAGAALQQGRRLLRRGQGDQALGYLETALNLYSAAKDNRGIAAAHNELGDLYLRQGQYKVALDHYQKSYQAFAGAQGQDQKNEAVAGSAANRVA